MRHDELCLNCGRPFGSHRGSDEACPANDMSQDDSVYDAGFHKVNRFAWKPAPHSMIPNMNKELLKEALKTIEDLYAKWLRLNGGIGEVEDLITRLEAELAKPDNPGRITRNEVQKFLTDYIVTFYGDQKEAARIRVAFEGRIDAIQSAPYVPEWEIKPPSAIGFRGCWTAVKEDGCILIPGEFYIPAPVTEPSDEELNTKLLAMSREQKIKALKINGGEE